MKKQLAIVLAVSLISLPFSSCAKKAGPGTQPQSSVSSGVSAVSEPVSSAPGTSSVSAVSSAPAKNTAASKIQAAGKAASKPAPPKPASTVNLMANIHAANIKTVAPPDGFYAAETNFSMNLLKNSYQNGQNCLLSPFSVYAALGMAANGAGGNTLKQFENVLGGGLALNSLDLYIKSYLKDLAGQNDMNTKISIADSVWLDDRFTPKTGFLQKNADYFGTGVFRADFGSPSAPGIINNWVAQHTENKITDLVDRTDSDEVMMLINTMVFHSFWGENFSGTHNETFTPANGKGYSTPFMERNYLFYLVGNNAAGALVPFDNSRFSLAVLLPNPGVSLGDTVRSLDAAKFRQMVKNPVKNSVAAITLPKFTTDFSIELVNPLAKMGLADAFFGNADFSAAAPGLYISNVTHKTYMGIDEKGADAVAATKIDTKCCIEGPLMNSKPQIIKITFNRPFLYAIVDTQNGLPLFIGTMENPKA